MNNYATSVLSVNQSAFLQIIQFDSLMVCRFHEKMPIKLTLHWPFSNMFTSLSWFSGNSGRAKDAGMSQFFGS